MASINDNAIQKRLLAKSKLTYKKAVAVAHSLETADKNIQLLKQPKKAVSVGTSGAQGTTVEVHRVGRRVTQNCYCCGNAGHIAPRCRFNADIVCNACGETQVT